MMTRNKKLRIFISRKLSKDSVLFKVFPANQYSWTDQSMVQFSHVPFDPPAESTDWLFFYSKMGVKYWSEKDNMAKTNQFKIACIGRGTAKFFSSIHHYEPHFVGEGLATDISQSLIKIVGSEKICFIRGENSVQSIQKNVIGQLDISECIVYKNEVQPTEALGDFNIAIFTSPLNFDGFNINKGSSKNMIAIGPTTAAAIQATIDNDQEHKRLIVSDEPSEESIGESLKLLIREAYSI